MQNTLCSLKVAVQATFCISLYLSVYSSQQSRISCCGLELNLQDTPTTDRLPSTRRTPYNRLPSSHWLQPQYKYLLSEVSVFSIAT